MGAGRDPHAGLTREARPPAIRWPPAPDIRTAPGIRAVPGVRPALGTRGGPRRRGGLARRFRGRFPAASRYDPQDIRHPCPSGPARSRSRTR
ncbi:hypothetical protein GCM10027187_33560 [Streptosporangium sandarakinum]